MPGGPLTISGMTSLATLVGTELIPLVSPGNNTATNANYNVTVNTLASAVIGLDPAVSSNTVYAGPSSGVATAVPTFRAIVLADLPGSASADILFGQGSNTSPLNLPVSGDFTFAANTAVATGTIAANAVTFAKFQTVTGLSVVGVTGTATANAAAITGTTDQVLRVSHGGTTLAFGAVNLATSAAVTGVLALANGGTNTASLPVWGPLYGGTSAVLGVNPGTSLWVFTANGTLAAPSFSQVSLTASVTGILGVAGGGTNTSTLTIWGPLYGGTTAIQAVTPGTTAWPLVANGTLAAPNFAILTVPGGGTGTSTIGSGVVVGNGAAGALSIVSFTTAGLNLQSAGSNSPPIWTAASVGSVTSVITGWGVTGGPITTNGTVSIATTNPPYGFTVPVNMGFTVSTSASALTINIVGNNAAAPSATNPVLFPFRDTTLPSGAVNWRSATAALSITVTQSATLGAISGNPFRAWITAHDTGTTPTIGVINCLVLSNATVASQIVPLAEHTLQTTIAISSTALSAGVFYAGVAVGNKPFTILGYFEYANMTTAGQYAGTPTTVQVFGPGIKKPGDSVQTVFSFTNATSSITTTIFTGTIMSASITPTSPVNGVWVKAPNYGNINNGNSMTLSMQRASLVIGPQLLVVAATAASINKLSVAYDWLDFPGSAAATTYQVFIASGTNNSAVIYPLASATAQGSISLTEIMV